LSYCDGPEGALVQYEFLDLLFSKIYEKGKDYLNIKIIFV